jgi:hypothetical protein
VALTTPRPDNPEGPGGVDAIAAELRLVVGRVRSAAMFDQLSTPLLDDLAGGHGLVPDAIAAAIGAVDDEPYRQFLRILLPLPFSPGQPWEPLTPGRSSEGRGERAAQQAFGVTWDACTKRSQLLDDRSRRDWAERLLAEQLLGDLAGGTAPAGPEGVDDPEEAPEDPEGVEDPEDAPGDAEDAPEDPEGVDDPEDAPGDPEDAPEDPEGVDDPDEPRPAQASQVTAPVSGGWKGPGAVRWLAVALGLLTVGIGAVVLLVTTRSEGDPPARDASGGNGCTAAGELDAELAALPDAPKVAASIREAMEDVDRPTACGAGPAERWEQLAVQTFDESPSDDSVVAVTRLDDLSTVVMSAAMYGQYRRLGSADGSVAQDVGGQPVDLARNDDGSVELTLSEGVLMVSQTWESPGFWIPAPFVDWYRAHPEVGLPAGNPLPDLTQDFVNGRVRVEEGVGPVADLVEDPGAELRTGPPIGGRILRQADSTAWWVDDAEVRHWIPDGRVWECLGGEAGRWPADVSGYAVASLALGDHAACDG